MRHIGIDFGTTNTLIAEDRKLLPVTAQGSTILPSVVAFLPTGTQSVGAPAKRRRAIDADNVLSSSKRLLGASWHSAVVRDLMEYAPVKLVELPGKKVGYQTRAGTFSPTQIASIVLDEALGVADVNPAETSATMTVPAAFDGFQRAAVVEAGKRAGLQNITVLDEPIATAMAYGQERGKGKAAVYDLGGGTFDFAVMEFDGEHMEIHAHDGEPFLGGDDVDLALARAVAEEVLAAHNWDLKSDPVVFDRLLAACEMAKISLTEDETTIIHLSQVDPDSPLGDQVFTITRNHLLEASRPIVQQTFLTCDAVMRQAGVTPAQLDTIYLAGGSTRLPLVRQFLEQYFGRPGSEVLDPLSVVSIGASINAVRAAQSSD